MTSPAHGSAEPWADDGWPADSQWPGGSGPDLDDHELLGQEHEPEDPPADDPWSEWDDIDDASAGGLTGRALILGTCLATGGCAVLNLALTGGRLTFFFDLCFVVICLVGAMSVRRRDLFTAGVLPPLAFAGVIAVLAVVAPDAFDSEPGLSTVFLSGLASHAVGLVAGYGVALLAIAARMAGSPKPVG